MSQTRELIPVILFNGQIIFSKRLFEPETKDTVGKPLDQPSYSLNVRFPKTKAAWWEEPALKPFIDACSTVKTRDMAGVDPRYVEYPIKDGDRPNKNGKVPEWAAGHWYIRASTTFPPKVEQLVNGTPSEIQSLMIGGRKLWGDGDYVAVALSIGKRLNDNIGIRAYLNGACFTGKGPELSTGGQAVDWGSAIQMAQQQGINIQQGGDVSGAGAGPFTGAPFPGAQENPQGFGTAPGFQPGGFQPQAAQAAQQQAPFGYPSQGAQAAQQQAPFGGGTPGSFGGAADPNKPPF